LTNAVKEATLNNPILHSLARYSCATLKSRTLQRASMTMH